MPCTISAEEEASYEREDNKRKFGLNVTDERLVTAVACAMAALLKKNKSLVNELPIFAQRWIKEHEIEDVKRKAEESKEFRRKAARVRARTKLTPEELEALTED